METRAHKGSVELRESPDGAPVIRGYFSVFNRDSADMGFIEQVDPGAFTKTLQESDIRGLGNHEPSWLLGRVKAGTMRAGVDSVGGWYEIDVNMADPDGQRAYQKVKRGDWDGSSFSFETRRDQWDWEQSPPKRRLLEVGLVDVGPVTFPAYPDATSSARAALAPIAQRMKLPLDRMVEALKAGEIRSLIDRAQSGSSTETLDFSSWLLEERATWSTAYVNDLPDSAFLHVDSDGNRHLPYKDKNGNVDLPHLRDAISRLSQQKTGESDGESWLTDSLRTELLAKARKILAAQKGSNSESFALEERVGKKISAASAASIRAAIDQLTSLLGEMEPAGEDDEPDNDGDDPFAMGPAGVPGRMIAALAELRDSLPLEEPVSLVEHARAVAALREREAAVLAVRFRLDDDAPSAA